MSNKTTVSLSRIGQLMRHSAILKFAKKDPRETTLNRSISDLLEGGATKEEASSIMKEIIGSAVQYCMQTSNDTECASSAVTESQDDERIGQIYTKIFADRMRYDTAVTLANIVGRFKNAGADDAETTAIVNVITEFSIASAISDADSAKA